MGTLSWRPSDFPIPKGRNTMKHSLIAVALLTLALTACGQKDAALAKPETLPVPAPAPATATVSSVPAPVDAAAPAPLEAPKPATAAGTEADLKQR
jgi:predicted small lipoprotein YifL